MLDAAARHRAGRAATEVRRDTAGWPPVLAGLLGAALTAGIASWLTAVVDVPGVPVPAVLVQWGLPLCRVLLDVAVAATLGLSLLPMLLGRKPLGDTAGVLYRARRFALLTAAAWFVASTAVLVLQAAELLPGTALTAGVVAGYVGRFGSGVALVISAGTAAAFVVVALIRRAPPGVLVPLAASGLLPMVFAGHAASLSVRGHDLMLICVELHVLAATAWTGGLGAVIFLLGRRPELLALALPRFSRLAGLCLATVAASGLGAATLRLVATPGVVLPDTLVGRYGLLVCAKLTCLAALALLGGYIRFRLLPLVAQRRRTAVVGWAVAELTVMGMAFGLAVVLSHAPVA